LWSPDGKHIAYNSSQTGLFWIRSDGSGSPEQLTKSEHILFPGSFSPDGKRLAYTEVIPETGFDIWMLPLEGDDQDHPKAGKPEPLLRTPVNERDPAFSPDGRWLAYTSDESGAFEVYVRPSTGQGSKWRISAEGGEFPIWSQRQRELFYQTSDNRIMVVPYVVNADSFAVGKPRFWSDYQLARAPSGHSMDLSPDGKHFAVLMPPEPGAHGTEITFLLNFFDELRRKAPVAK
jgi:serine/threonine-protein kinase